MRRMARVTFMLAAIAVPLFLSARDADFARVARRDEHPGGKRDWTAEELDAYDRRVYGPGGRALPWRERHAASRAR